MTQPDQHCAVAACRGPAAQTVAGLQLKQCLALPANPCAGDAQLSISQRLSLSGAVIVTTPQASSQDACACMLPC